MLQMGEVKTGLGGRVGVERGRWQKAEERRVAQVAGKVEKGATLSSSIGALMEVVEEEEKRGRSRGERGRIRLVQIGGWIMQSSFISSVIYISI